MVPFRNLKRFIGKALRQPFYALRVAAKRLTAYYFYYFSKGKSSFPEAITFFLTRSCNLRCRMCGQWGDHGVTKQGVPSDLKERLSLDEIKRVLEEARAFSPSITLFGGEPLLHPDLLTIVREVKSRKMHCLVITNGVLLQSQARQIVEAGLDELNISVDGGRELHDRIRGLPGVFDKIMAGIDEVNRVKAALRRQKPLINLQCTINQDNYERLRELLGVASRAQAASLTFHNLIFLKSDLVEQQAVFDRALGCSSREWEGFVFEPGINPRKLYPVIQDILSQKHNFAVDFYPNFSEKGLVEYYENPDYLPTEYASRCKSPWICAYIFPDGNVRPCLNCTYAFGNIKTDSFLKIWNSPDAVRYRKALKKEGIFPACRRCTELYRY